MLGSSCARCACLWNTPHASICRRTTRTGEIRIRRSGGDGEPDVGSVVDNGGAALGLFGGWGPLRVPGLLFGSRVRPFGPPKSVCRHVWHAEFSGRSWCAWMASAARR
jgi:hypothetical protein